MSSATPTPDEVHELLGRAHSVAGLAGEVRGRYRRRSHPGDPDRRKRLTEVHAQLVDVSEALRRERIRAARDKTYGRLYGWRLTDASAAVKAERYKVYRMLNPGGHKWTP